MDHQGNLFKEFKATSAEAWLAKITVDLKGKDPEALNHQIGENISLSPFHHADTLSTSAGPIVRNTEGNEWLIGESFLLAEDLRLTNKAILHALENGVEAIKITVSRKLKKEDFIQLFDQIELSYIHTHFTIDKTLNPLDILSEFNKILSKKTGDKNAFYGSVSGIELPDSALQSWKTIHLPNFKTWSINAPFNDDPVEQLITMIKDGVEGFTKSESSAIAKEVVFKMKIGTDFFLEIAKLRALRVLWANVLKSYGLEPTIYPKIMVDFDTSSQTEDPNQNMIRATTMAMAAALGGADFLTILPAGDEEDRSTFYRRIARNVQHILKMESFLNRVNDIAAGSYYVETLTTKIGEAVWRKIGNVN